jgi:hypothetical protein
MKKFILKPGFETIFALALIVILGLPPVLLAQSEKEVEIKIVNGDTTVNGKNIKDLSKEERVYALRDIKHLSHPMMVTRDSVKMGSINRMYIRKHRDSLGRNEMMMDIRREPGQRDFGFDSRRFERGPRGMNRKNIQIFNYENIDNEGISTHIRFSVSEISNEDLKRMPHVEGGRFEIENLSIVPEFNTGSTLLMFNLPEKTEAEVKLINSEGKILWNEKVEVGHFSKTFGLGLNGVYFLQIKQGNFFAVRRIVKEE